MLRYDAVPDCRLLYSLFAPFWLFPLASLCEIRFGFRQSKPELQRLQLCNIALLL